MELLRFSGVSWRILRSIESLLLKRSQVWVGYFNGVFHNKVINSFNTGGFSLRPFIEVERFAVVILKVISDHLLQRERGQGHSLRAIFLPGRDIETLEKHGSFFLIGHLVQEERNDSLASVGGRVVNLEFSNVFFIVHEVFLGEFKHSLVGSVDHLSVIVRVGHVSEITGQNGLVAVRLSDDVVSSSVFEFDWLALDLFDGWSLEGNWRLVAALLAFGWPALLVFPGPVAGVEGNGVVDNEIRGLFVNFISIIYNGYLFDFLSKIVDFPEILRAESPVEIVSGDAETVESLISIGGGNLNSLF